ncbi:MULTISPECIES: ABC transporter permease [Brevibacillus]|jgi:peptide/nickel transport system permease protein|uniref:Peptide/nickel transport system permease protein n=2 Tax=Brevibacillus TaxID=55080 RepID=A0A1I3WDW9_9BACL|nr:MULTISPECIES: ABC transporter permease [Brevibacillus]MEC2130956.1 ABC transporter permease [Brevibacillus centrosporus]MED1792401.1 ABC transporter permease [Brevibacillus nitrificans]MED4907528.1 ABC transporter permease [Brevibacillus centrosporus]RNB63383.1 ABC transporter permease [Brevibacillus centrosporus]RNB81711.1 ABC transporter permease [Brevibacillus nitrificans]
MADTQVQTVPLQVKDEQIISPWREAWRALRKNKLAMAGLGIILFFVVVAVFAPIIAPYPYDEGELVMKNKPPSEEHWFGTDYNGRDVFSRVVYGARISLWVGTFSVIGSVVAGTVLGLLAGYYGKWIDTLISRIFDIMLAFPSILLAIAIVAILGPSLQNALLAIAIINIPTFGRLVRSRVLSLKEEEFVMAARAIGMKDSRILMQHILPNSLAPIIVTGTMGIATAIIEAAALGFLGLGAQPPEPEWGKMLSDSRQYIQKAPWTVIFPGLSIMLTVLGFNLIGDGLRDALDPRMKN